MAKWPYCTSAWKKLRDQHMKDNPLCLYCYQVGVYTPATQVDHIERVRNNKDRAFDPNNLQSLCDQCHNGAKQKEESLGHAIGCDHTGMPRKGW